MEIDSLAFLNDYDELQIIIMEIRIFLHIFNLFDKNCIFNNTVPYFYILS